MGFRMNYFRILFFCQLLTSCLKPPQNLQDFGPEASLESINSALGDAPITSPYSIEAGEFVYIEKWQQVESSSPTLIAQEGQTISQKEDKGDHYLLTLVTEIRQNIDGQMKPTLTESSVRLNKPTALEQLAHYFSFQKNIDIRSEISKVRVPFLSWPDPFKTLGANSRASIAAKSSNTASSPKAQKVTYHNLEVETISWSTPSLVKERQNCGGLPAEPCQQGVATRRIRFDRVLWEERGGDKMSFAFHFSDQVPYLANQLSVCMEAKVDYQGQRLNLLQCETVKDFTSGLTASTLGVKKWKKK